MRFTIMAVNKWSVGWTHNLNTNCPALLGKEQVMKFMVNLPDMVTDYRIALSPVGLSYKVYSNVTLSPANFAPDSLPTRIRFTALSEEHEPPDCFRFHRQGTASPIDSIYPENPIRLPGTYIYGGVVQNQYGAPLTESLSRYWFIRENANLPILWHHIQRRENFLPFQNEIFSLCGIAMGRSKLINHPIVVDRIIVPDPGCVLDCWLAATDADSIGVFPFAREPKSNRRIWISRSSLRDGLGKVLGEDLLELELAKRGWTILTPENHSVWWQLHEMSDAVEIAGFEGSAFHTLLLADRCEARVTLFARGQGQFPIMHSLIGSGKRLRQNFGRVPLQHVSGSARTQVMELVDPKAVADFIDLASSQKERKYTPRLLE
jgi:hypothetical protein